MAGESTVTYGPSLLRLPLWVVGGNKKEKKKLLFLSGHTKVLLTPTILAWWWEMEGEDTNYSFFDLISSRKTN